MALGHANVLKRARETSYGQAQYTNSTTRVTLTSTTRVTATISEAPSVCTGCEYGEPGYHVSFEWPIVAVSDFVAATVIYKVDKNNVTSTITRYSNSTIDPTLHTVLDAAKWNSILHTTGVTVENGTPHFKYAHTMYTAPGSPYVVSSTL
jgi:hypothetical protein